MLKLCLKYLRNTLLRFIAMGNLYGIVILYCYGCFLANLHERGSFKQLFYSSGGWRSEWRYSTVKRRLEGILKETGSWGVLLFSFFLCLMLSWKQAGTQYPNMFFLTSCLICYWNRHGQSDGEFSILECTFWPIWWTLHLQHPEGKQSDCWLHLWDSPEAKHLRDIFSSMLSVVWMTLDDLWICSQVQERERMHHP